MPPSTVNAPEIVIDEVVPEFVNVAPEGIVIVSPDAPIVIVLPDSLIMLLPSWHWIVTGKHLQTQELLHQLQFLEH